MSPPGVRSIALVACRVLEAEIAAALRGTTHVVRQEFFEVGAHDQPMVLRTRLARAIESAERDPAVEAVVLGYGLCGLALVNLAPRRCPLVVPRAHDCLTLFLGSKERYAACMQEEPGTYWYTPGWCRGGRGPGPERDERLREEYRDRFAPEELTALLEMDRAAFAHHDTAGYTDHGLPGNEQYRDEAARCALALGWRFRYHAGHAGLLRDLLSGAWDRERFLIVEPGERIVHRADDSIVAAVPVAGP